MLSEILIAGLVRDHRQTDDPTVRLRYGKLSGLVGIAVNALLSAAKIVLAIISGSVALGADALNNLSDAGGALVTLFGFQLSAKPADNEHPFGHGRMEYVAAVIISVLIISAGLNFFRTAIERIVTPQEIFAPNWLVVVTAATLLVKVWLAFFYREVGKRIASQALQAQFWDSLSDLLTTFLVVVSMVLPRFCPFPVDGIAGLLVAGVTVWGGISVLKNASDPLLGVVPDSQLVEKLRNVLLAQPGILGVHDIIIHSYGPALYFATAHAEVTKDGDLVHTHDILENAEVAVAKQLPIRLLLHCDPFGDADRETVQWRAKLERIVTAFDPVFKVYDFRCESEPPVLDFYLLTPRTYSLSNDEIHARLEKIMQEFDPRLRLNIHFVHAFV